MGLLSLVLLATEAESCSSSSLNVCWISWNKYRKTPVWSHGNKTHYFCSRMEPIRTVPLRMETSQSPGLPTSLLTHLYKLIIQGLQHIQACLVLHHRSCRLLPNFMAKATNWEAPGRTALWLHQRSVLQAPGKQDCPMILCHGALVAAQILLLCKCEQM